MDKYFLQLICECNYTRSFVGNNDPMNQSLNIFLLVFYVGTEV